MDGDFGREVNEGILNLDIEDVKNIKPGDKMECETVVIQTFPWKMTVTRGNNDNYTVQYVCNEKSASTLWKCMANITLTCRISGPSMERLQVEQICDSKSLDYLDNRMEMIFHTDVWPGFPEAKKMHLDVKIHLSRVSGVRKRKIIDYSLEQPVLFNGILSIEGQKVHINKQLLAMHSKFFENLFFGNFAENQLEIVELPDVKHSEFCDFLNIIHPTQTDIAESTVESLLKMADRFQTEEVAARCEKFLMSSKEVPMAKKLILAQQYSLGELMDKCLKSFHCLEDMFPLKSSEFYDDLNDDVKAALLERLVKCQDD